jgi:Mrp family chromosome partitioning ATPase
LDPSQPTGQLANLYRSLINDIDVSVGKDSQMPIAIVSAGAGAGRSTVAANLARTRLTKGQKVLLVDADLRQQAGRRPHELLHLATMQTGLYEHVLQGHSLTPNIEENGALQYIGTSADKVTDDGGLVALGAKNLAKFLKPFQKGSYTIVDLPPVTDLEVTLEIAGQLKNALIVVQSGVTRRNELMKTMAQLKKRGINCIATVVVDVPAERLESAKLFALPTLGGPFRVWSKLSFA